LKFDEIWSLLVKELFKPKHFKTIKQEKEFEALYSDGKIIVTPGTRYKRPISKSEFVKVWDIFKKTLNPYRPVLYQQDTYHASYILAIIRYFLKQEKAE